MRLSIRHLDAMARKPRIEYPGALYHVFSRGNNKNRIFWDAQDFRVFIKRIKRYHEKYDFKLYAYVLMPNHFHFLLQTSQIPLSKVMQGMLQSYAIWFHKKYKSVGHLFQSRYTPILCQQETYFLTLIRYILMNPVRAGLADTPEQYPWSSYSRCLIAKADDFVAGDEVLNLFSSSYFHALEMLKKFLCEDIPSEQTELRCASKDKRLMGDEIFVEEILKRISIPEEKKKVRVVEKDVSLDSLLEIVSMVTGIPGKAIRGIVRQSEIADARALFASVAVKYLGKRNIAVAHFLDKQPSSISCMIEKIEKSETTNPGLYELFCKVIEIIKA